jgi:hypothetical protein
MLIKKRTYCSCPNVGTPRKSKLIRQKTHSFEEIHNGYFSQKVAKERGLHNLRQVALRFRSENTDINYAIDKMVSIYPRDVLKRFIVGKLLNHEELFYFKQKLATSLAYSAFVGHALNTGYLKRN